MNAKHTSFFIALLTRQHLAANASACLSGMLLLLACGFAQAAPLSFSGTLTSDDQRASLSFSVTTAGPVDLRSWSFGGGVNAAGANVNRGGFAPVVSLFDADGGQSLLAIAGAGDGSCTGNTDSSSGYCWDIDLAINLAVGHYIAIITEDDNRPLGADLAAGFSRDGQGNFTGPAYRNAPGQFILATGAQRDGYWALDLSGSVAVPVPEPAPLALFALGLPVLRLFCARSKEVI